MDSTYKSLNDKGKQYFLAAAVGGGIIMSLGFLVMMGGIMAKDKNMGMILGGFFMFIGGMTSLICAYKVIGVKPEYKLSYCENDADCGTSKVCMSNSCTGPSYAPAGCDKTNNCPIQSYCSKAEDCGSGHCSNGKCLVLPCIATKTCGKDTTCTDGSICASGTCTAGLCAAVKNQSVPNTGTGPTCSSTSCVNGTCVNGTCTCLSGFNMVNGICNSATVVQTPVVQTPVVQTPVVSTSGPSWPPDGNLTGYISSTLPPNTTRMLEYKAANNLDASLSQSSRWGKTSELGTLAGDSSCFMTGRQIAISSDGNFWATSYSPGTKYPKTILPSTMFYDARDVPSAAAQGYGIPSDTCASNGLAPN